MSLTPNEQIRLAGYLNQIAFATVEEWMRIVDLDQDDDDERLIPARIQSIQARVTWGGDGTFILGPHRHDDSYGTYRLIVRVEPIDVPPLGPENDPALMHEMSWEDRTLDDVRTGDRINFRGTEAVVHSAYRRGWHVHPASHYTVIPLEHSDVCLRLVGREDKLYVLKPDLPVRIHLTDHEISALDALGWENRACVITEAMYAALTS